MAEWRHYQEETAKLFRELGCSVETDFLAKGVRRKHRLDVSVRFTRFGLNQHWIVECKLWNRPVPPERVEILKSITAELGADRGILIAERGYQSGAYEATTLTNITLTTLAKLREAAKGDLLALALPDVKRRAIAIRHDADSLFDEVDLHLFDDVRQPGFYQSVMHTPKPGADSSTLYAISSTAHRVEAGASDAELGSFPIRLICHFDEKDNYFEGYRFDCNNLEEFVTYASYLLDSLDRVLLQQKQRVQAANGARP